MTTFTLDSSGRLGGDHAAASPSADSRTVPVRRSIGNIVLTSVLVSMVVVFAGVAGAFALFGGTTAEAIGIGAYLSFWLGGGFGVIVAGVVMSIQDERLGTAD